MIKLLHPFPSIRKEGALSYGGNQSWTRQKFVQKSGCGVISCTDLLIYLHRYRAGCSTELFSKIIPCETARRASIHACPEGTPNETARRESIHACPKSTPYETARRESIHAYPEGMDDDPILLEEYNNCVDALRRKYLPVIPYFGMNGFMLALGLNRYFRKYHMNLKAVWCISSKKLWQRMKKMLQVDVPVIFAIGPDFPLIWRKHKLTLYKKRADGRFVSVCQTNAHFVTVTAMDKEWLRISSWGKEYYINRKEYDAYVRNYSSFLVSNMVFII